MPAQIRTAGKTRKGKGFEGVTNGPGLESTRMPHAMGGWEVTRSPLWLRDHTG